MLNMEGNSKIITWASEAPIVDVETGDTRANSMGSNEDLGLTINHVEFEDIQIAEGTGSYKSSHNDLKLRYLVI